MNNKRKEAAMNKVSQFLAQKLSKEEIFAEMAKDEKNYTPEELDKIWDAVSAASTTVAPSTPSEDDSASVLTPAAAVIVTNPTPEPAKTEPAAGGTTNSSKTPNAAIAAKLAKFDYNKMSQENFREYMEFVHSLGIYDMYDFEVYKVKPVREVRFEGVENSPIDIVGFSLVNKDPLKTTRIDVKHAIAHNGFLKSGKNYFTVDGGQWYHAAGPVGQYFLLKK